MVGWLVDCLDKCLRMKLVMLELMRSELDVRWLLDIVVANTALL